MDSTSEHYLSKAEENTLLLLARTTLEAYVHTSTRPKVEEFDLTDTLRKPHGAFVTLRKADELRGCIGYTSNTKPLAQTVLDSTVSSASNDPRFSPVTPGELDQVTIEVSALTAGDKPDTPFRRLDTIGDIVIGRDGLYIERGAGKGGLLLPQIPVEQRWNVDQFLSALCRKAGLPDGAWNEADTILYRFSAQVFKENDEPAH